jgi:hypothetical protein
MAATMMSAGMKLGRPWRVAAPASGPSVSPITSAPRIGTIRSRASDRQKPMAISAMAMVANCAMLRQNWVASSNGATS